MKCCASQTTSTVPSARPATSQSREVAAAFEALLFAAAFKPLAKALGFYGDAAVAAATQTMARNERGGLTDRLERALEAGSRPQAAGVER